MIYLDHASTTKPKDEVVEVITNVLKNEWGNPSSKHSLGKSAKDIMEESRKTIAEFIGAKPSEIIFTSGACESNSLAIVGYLKKNPSLFFTTEIEHKSIMNCAKDRSAEYIPVEFNGLINLPLFESILKDYHDRHKLVSIQFANNEIGTIQDMKKISEIVHKYNGILHTDATQIIPDRKIDVNDLGIDMLSFSGQKLGAPKGIGVLYVKDGIEIAPIIYGSQENSLRGGTENVAYIAGLAKAVEILKYPTNANMLGFCIMLNKKIEDVYLVGDYANRLSNNAAICFPGIESNSLVQLLNMEDMFVSTGSACNSSSIEPSHVLKAIGMKEDEIYSVVRFSFGEEEISYEEMDELTDIVSYNVEMLKTFKI